MAQYKCGMSPSSNVILTLGNFIFFEILTLNIDIDIVIQSYPMKIIMHVSICQVNFFGFLETKIKTP